MTGITRDDKGFLWMTRDAQRSIGMTGMTGDYL